MDYEVITSGNKYQLDGVKDPLIFLKEIKEGRISIEESKNIQKQFNKQLNFIRRGNKNREQKETLNNINNLYNARDMAIKFIENYGSIILDAKRIVKQEG